jgi:heterotetrameric sarcosine oxidase gamma subunit
VTRYAAAISLLPPRAIVELRGDQPAAERCLSMAGLPSPAAGNRLTDAGAGCAVLWLGPHRWFVMAPALHENRLETGLLATVAQEPTLLGALVSDAHVGFALRGREAGEILAQGTPLDISDRSFFEGAATFTEFFAVTALLLRPPDGFEVWVDRSLGEYIHDWLRVAVGEQSA